MARSTLASRVPGGLPGDLRSGRAGQPRARSAGCTESATLVWCSHFGNSHWVTLVPARPLHSRGTADWAAGARAAAPQPPGDPASRAQQFRLRRPAETAGAERGAGQGRRARGAGRGTARGDEYVRNFQREPPSRALLLAS